jgi:ATP-dependent Lon protease
MPSEKEPPIIDVEPRPEADEAASLSQDRSMVIARDILPETLLIVPVFERPLFPKMMGPLLIAGEELKREVAEALQSSQPCLGVVLVRPALGETFREPAAAGDFHPVGVAVQVVQAMPPQAEGPLQLVAQVLQRFSIRDFVSEAPVFRARVEYWHETRFETNEELRAYSVAVVDDQELVKEPALQGGAPPSSTGRCTRPERARRFAAAGHRLAELRCHPSIRRRIEQV